MSLSLMSAELLRACGGRCQIIRGVIRIRMGESWHLSMHADTQSSERAEKVAVCILYAAALCLKMRRACMARQA